MVRFWELEMRTTKRYELETKLKQHIAEERWDAIHFLYEESSEELRLKYAYPFGKAYLRTKLSEGISSDSELEQLTHAFRISLYDYRMTETIREICGSDIMYLIESLDRKARLHIEKSSNGEANGAEHSKFGSECYQLILYLYPDRQEAIRRTSKAAIFLLETFVATHINNTCMNQESWESLLDTLLRMKVLDAKFINAIIAFLRVYNAFRPTEKILQLNFMRFLLTHKDSFFDHEIDRMDAFVSELESESIGVLLDILKGEGDDKEKNENEQITRAEELKQFAIDNADCPEDLDHTYFKETQVHKKVTAQLENSNPGEAFQIFQNEFPEGFPENAALIRPLFIRTVTELYAETGLLDCVVIALELDPTNHELKELLINF